MGGFIAKINHLQAIFGWTYWPEREVEEIIKYDNISCVQYIVRSQNRGNVKYLTIICLNF